MLYPIEIKNGSVLKYLDFKKKHQSTTIASVLRLDLLLLLVSLGADDSNLEFKYRVSHFGFTTFKGLEM